MKKVIIKKLKTHKNKLKASFLAGLMIFQALSMTINVVANEMGKVKLSDQYGEYFNREIQPKILNKGIEDASSRNTITKKPIIYNDNMNSVDGNEVETERTENSKTFIQNDGTFLKEIYFEPVHKKEENGFVEIDNTLENVSLMRSNPVYENKNGLYDFRVFGNTMQINGEDNYILKFINADANLDTYATEENVILYSEAYKNIDMEYRLGGDKVSTNFIINGKTDVSKINFKLEHSNLEFKEYVDYLDFVDQNGKSIFKYVKPTMNDGNGKQANVIFSYVKNKDYLDIQLELDSSWLENSERVFPVQVQAKAAYDPVVVDMDSSYIRSAQPTVTSRYHDLFVGFDDGSLNTFEYLGETRSYLHVGNLGLGNDKVILDAKLSLYKKIQIEDQWNQIAVGKTAGYVDPATVNWGNKPSSIVNMNITNVRVDPGWQEFDIKSYIEDIYVGKNNTLELKATNSNSNTLANVFYSESGIGLPKVTIKYKDAFDVRPDLNINTFHEYMRIYSIQNDKFYGFSFDGIAKPDSKVIFSLVKKDKNEVLLQESTTSNKYFVDPIFITNYISGTQIQEKKDGNFTTNYILENKIPEFDVPYEYKVTVKKGTEESTLEYRTDAFVKYKVKLGDTLQTISTYYGVKIEDIKKDNNITVDIIKENDILLVRMKKNNPKVSKETYTPPERIAEYKAKYVNRGPRCVGTCDIIDPVNATTGNYFNVTTDFTLIDFEDIKFNRYYNSTGPQISNMFGNGFTSIFESYVSYDKDGNMHYFYGDGKIYEFKKNGENYEARKQDHFEIRKDNNHIVIKDLDTNYIYTFNKYGSLDIITTDLGKEIKVNYDDYGYIVKVDIGAKEIKFNYNDKNLVKEVVLPNGATTAYFYDKNRNLVEFKDVNGNSIKYNYNEDNYLTYAVDKNGYKTALNTYDSDGRVIKQSDANGNITTLSYNANSSVVINADGTRQEFIFDNSYRITEMKNDDTSTYKYVYDNYGNISKEIDREGNETTYIYDKENLLKVDYPDKTFEEYRYNTNNQIVYSRHRDGSVENRIYNGLDEISNIDANGNAMYFEYDNEHRLIKETNIYGASKSYEYTENQITTVKHSNGLIENFEYDANGNTLKESDNQGKVTTYVYNLNGEMIQKNYPDGSDEKWTYDGNGNIVEYQDRLGGVTTNVYDKNNNLISSTKGLMTNSYEYDVFNNCISETDIKGNTIRSTYNTYNKKETETDIYGNKTTFLYDEQGQLIKTIDPFGNEEIQEYKYENLVKSISKEGITTLYKYDELNREVEKTNHNGFKETKIYDGDKLLSTVDEYGKTIENKYDSFGRIIERKTIYLDGMITITKITYDEYNNIISENVDGAVTSYEYDVYNRKIKTVDPLQNTTTFMYDFNDNIIEETDPLGNKKITKYNANADVISETDKNGNITTKQYDTNGFLINETDAMGFTYSYIYNNKGQIVEEIDPYNVHTVYVYDTYGNQIESKIDGSTIEKKLFDAYGREIEVENQENHMSSKYDSFGRVTNTINHVTGLETVKKYDEYGNIVEESDSEGLKTIYTYDTHQRNIETQDAYGRKQTQVYGVRGNVIEKYNYDGTCEKMEYDVKGNVIRKIDVNGQTTTSKYNVSDELISEKIGEKETQFEYNALGKNTKIIHINNNSFESKVYDANGNLIEEIDALGNQSKKEYNKNNLVITEIDARGNKICKEYDAFGNLIKEVNPLGGSKQNQYNKFGQLEKEIDERGFVITYLYDENHKLVETIDQKGNSIKATYNEVGQLVSEENANGGITEYSYDAYNRIVEVIEPNGKIISITYDAIGNATQEKDGEKITTNIYDSYGRLIQKEVNGVIQEKNKYNKYNQIIEKEDANGNVSEFTYDLNGNVVYQNEKGYIIENKYDVYNNLISKIENKKYVELYTYDSKGQLIATSINNKKSIEKTYDANGNEIKVVESGLTKEFTYDVLNRPIEMKVPSGDGSEMIVFQKITYDESGNVIEEMDALGNKILRTYDAKNNIISETNANGITNTFEYDALNNLTKAQNANGRYVSYTYNSGNDMIIKLVNSKYATYEYDEQHNLIVENNEYGYTSKYEYDFFGNKTSYINPNGVEIKFEYDKLNNKIKENDSIFTYDKRGNLKTASNKEGKITYTYNDFDQITSVVDTEGKKVTYVYNEDKLLTSEIYEGINITYTYNENRQLFEVKKNDIIIATYAYNSRGENTALVQGNVETKTEYDNDGSVIRKTSIKDGKTIQDTSYVYDSNGNLIEETINGKKNTYEYNKYDELLKSKKYIDNEYITTTYAYDLYGNKTIASSNGENYQYNYNDKNQVESIVTPKGTVKYNYDKNGNVSEKINEDKSVDKYVFDDNNKLVQLTKGQYQYDYFYDAQQNRIAQIKTDLKDYHFDVWYDYNVEFEVTSTEQLANGFDELRKQIESKEKNGGICSYIDSSSYDVTYYKEPEVTNYMLERNSDYAQVLSINGKTNVFGISLLESDNEIQVKGLNDSIVAKVGNDKITKITYNDFGKTNSQIVGHGYNSEMMDDTGLIYLRARYYDPEVAQFIQIDNNYSGEKETVNTQNRYAYTLNNPYKYVDKDGNRSIKIGEGTGAVEKLLKSSWLQKSLKEFTKIVKALLPSPSVSIAINAWKNANIVKGNKTSNKNSGKNTNNIGLNKSQSGFDKVDKKTLKRRIIEVKCPEIVSSIKNVVSAAFVVTHKILDLNFNLGIISITIEKFVKTKIELSQDNAKKLAGVGITTSTEFNLRHDLNIVTALSELTSMGMSYYSGDWGDKHFNLSATVCKTTYAVEAVIQTLNPFADNYLGFSVETEINEYVSIEDTLSVSSNPLALALLTLAVVVTLPASAPAFAVAASSALTILQTLTESIPQLGSAV
ncbi:MULTISPECIES: RHS repeat-associated core domain-containing protein [unclassified Breznakia]|uniref:RHS repeat-associated core domain-containing protein n=1 Tax=unclassified Breznakia TaxID=2623764 RepID=UPI002475868F|nr:MULTISPECIES: RHS repeat-associated core domain-containing protein [unclassified Breznakia]